MAKPRDRRIVPRVSPTYIVLPGGAPRRLDVPGIELTQAFDRANQLANIANVNAGGQTGTDVGGGPGGVGGQPGTIGRPGRDGTAGVDGRDGNRWWVGEGYPITDFGGVDDFYLDLETCTILQKINLEDWVYAGEMGCGNAKLAGDGCEQIIWQPVVDSEGTFLITDWGGVVWAHRTLTCEDHLEWTIKHPRPLTVVRSDGYYDVVVSDYHILTTYD